MVREKKIAGGGRAIITAQLASLRRKMGTKPAMAVLKKVVMAQRGGRRGKMK